MDVNSGIRAIDIMTNPIISASADMTIVEASKLMNTYRIGGLPVIENDVLVGMITERDIMRKVIAMDKQPSETLVKDIMESSLKIVGSAHEDMNSLARKMSKYDITRIPILDGNKVIGIVTNRDILRNAPELIDIIIEQAKLKGDIQKEPTAYGKCENCGSVANLVFEKNSFLCELCLEKPIKELQK